MDTNGMINLVVVGLMAISFMMGLIMGNQMNNRDNDNNYRF